MNVYPMPYAILIDAFTIAAVAFVANCSSK